MFTLSLLRFTPLSKESHLVAVVLGVLAFIADYIVIPNATATSSFGTAIVAGVCWYLYKTFDGLTYDGADLAVGPVAGFFACIVVCAGYYWF
ncbi:hypothetical protein PS865_04402 [Pseudomonas fluorescens]|uniref:hypothetical protein n=1 Tax=Pseudomonas fluorescens TaxID=294 RepID=UPI00123F87FE|nr:hypothetical protein [Pseudomonas fluorescens]VVP31849.1 hypothetical protein PS865_04402 [Pseudomonas fluorescens]